MRIRLLPALLVTLLSLPGWSAPLILFDNLGAGGGVVAAVDATNWEAQQFSTGSNGGFLTQASLSVLQLVAGSSIVDIYTSVANEPGTWLGTLTTVGTYSSTSPSVQVYSGAIALTANSAYYAVLKAPAGIYGWNFTNSNSGFGIGFSTRYAETGDSGVNWFSSTGSPNKMRLLMYTDVPELNARSAPLALMLVAGMLLHLSSRRGRSC